MGDPERARGHPSPDPQARGRAARRAAVLLRGRPDGVCAQATVRSCRPPVSGDRSFVDPGEAGQRDPDGPTRCPQARRVAAGRDADRGGTADGGRRSRAGPDACPQPALEVPAASRLRLCGGSQADLVAEVPGVAALAALRAGRGPGDLRGLPAGGRAGGGAPPDTDRPDRALRRAGTVARSRAGAALLPRHQHRHRTGPGWPRSTTRGASRTRASS